MKKTEIPVSTAIGPGGRLKYWEIIIPMAELIPPKIVASTVNGPILRVKFLAAAAGIITRAPIKRAPIILIPRATTRATMSKNIKSVFGTFTFSALARSSETVLKIKFLDIFLVIKKTATAIIMPAVASKKLTFEMSPKRASRIPSFGTRRKPIARLNVKKTPTRVSVGNFVLFYINQIAVIPSNRAANAPRNGLNPRTIPRARPGRAT